MITEKDKANFAILKQSYDVVWKIDVLGTIIAMPNNQTYSDIDNVLKLFDQSNFSKALNIIENHIARDTNIFPIFYPKGHIKWARLACIIYLEDTYFCLTDATQEYYNNNKNSNIAEYDYLTHTKYRHDLNAIIDSMDNEDNLPLALFMIDVNGMKLTNDAFGYEYGDLLLKKCTTIIKSIPMNDGVLIRMNGDEFLLIVPTCEKDHADFLLESLVKACNEDTESMILPSLSIGVAIKEKQTESIIPLLRDAEQNLYASRVVESVKFKAAIIKRLQSHLSRMNYESASHITRVKGLASLLGDAINLGQEQRMQLSLAAELHDIGKVSIPEEILSKKSPLTKDEWEVVKQHPATAYRIIYGLGDYSNVAKIVLHHHERYDGSGYPHKLKHDEIPLLSRILTLVDAYDNMINNPYKKSKTRIQDVINELNQYAGKQFDPKLVKTFLSCIKNS